MDNTTFAPTTFAPVNFDTIEEGYICDSGQYEGMTNSDINIASIMENIEGRINFKMVEKDKNYDSLCKINKNIDDSIGLSILIIKLELNNILENYINPTIQRMFNNIILDDEDICYKYIISMYNIFNILDKSYIEKYKDNLTKLMNENISKKNKFKIMDILEKV